MRLISLIKPINYTDKMIITIPKNIFAEALSDSHAVVPTVTCKSQPTFFTKTCITPQ